MRRWRACKCIDGLDKSMNNAVLIGSFFYLQKEGVTRMDRIELKNMLFFGYHGVLEEEKRLGQRFQVDVVIEADLRKAGETDDVVYTIDYARVYDMVRDVMIGDRMNLLEAVAERIAAVILHEFTAVRKALITIRKPEAPISGILDYAAVTVERDRIL